MTSIVTGDDKLYKMVQRKNNKSHAVK